MTSLPFANINIVLNAYFDENIKFLMCLAKSSNRSVGKKHDEEKVDHPCKNKTLAEIKFEMWHSTTQVSLHVIAFTTYCSFAQLWVDMGPSQLATTPFQPYLVSPLPAIRDH